MAAPIRAPTAFRITDTAVGEFLYYTIDVAQAGNYDIDFRASSPAEGAACHLEIDDTDVTGQVAIPNTAAFDAMDDNHAPRGAADGGPHVMTLEFDAGLPSGHERRFRRLLQLHPPHTGRLARDI
jgi:hypothetical protein